MQNLRQIYYTVILSKIKVVEEIFDRMIILKYSQKVLTTTGIAGIITVL
jgi:hypothetical protein